MVLYKPAQIPAPWFDEGWTLSVARNWVEHGIYARLLDGVPVSYVGMAWSFPVTVPVGISFRLFGIGVLQGRLPNILLTTVSLILLFRYSRYLYNESIGLLALLVVLFASTVPNILVMGRQVLAETPMIFYLALGFISFSKALSGSNWFLILTIFSWGTAITCKQHPLPFLSFALFICLLFSFIYKKYQIMFRIFIIWLGSITVYLSLIWIEGLLTKDLPLYGAPMRGLYEVTAFVLDKQIRLDTIKGFVTFGIPTFLGLCYGFYDLIHENKRKDEPWFYVNLTFLIMCLSWLLWFVFFSIGWSKYFFPIAFLSSIYLAVMLDRFTHHFDIKYLATTIGGNIKRFRLNWNSVKVMISILIIIDGIVFTYFYFSILNAQANNAPEKVAEYINHNIPADALIETYDPEVIFLVNRPVHFPPDQIQVELNRRLNLDPETHIDYDPLAADPDIIVIGPFSKTWGLYETITKSGQFTNTLSVLGYEVYRANRIK